MHHGNRLLRRLRLASCAKAADHSQVHLAGLAENRPLLNPQLEDARCCPRFLDSSGRSHNDEEKVCTEESRGWQRLCASQ